MKKIAPLGILALALPLTYISAPQAHAADTATVSCSRATLLVETRNAGDLPQPGAPSTTTLRPYFSANITDDRIAGGETYTFSVVMSDGTNVSGTESAIMSGRLLVSGGLSATNKPVSVRVTFPDGSSTSYQLGDELAPDGTPSPTCQAPLPVTVTQNPVCGDDNDTYTLPAGVRVMENPDDPSWVGDTGWQGNQRTIYLQADTPWLTNGTDVGRRVAIVLTDGGACTPQSRTVTVTTPVTTTRIVPIYGNRITVTDPVVGTFQVDSYRPRTTAQVNTLKANSARNMLPFRYDGPDAPQLARTYKRGRYASLWGRSTSEFVTIKASDVKRYGSLAKAINAKTRKAANIGGTIAIGKTYTTAWKLGVGATIRNPWGTRNNVVQTEFDAVTVPRGTTTITRVQTGTQTITSTTMVTSTRTVIENVAPTIALVRYAYNWEFKPF